MLPASLAPSSVPVFIATPTSACASAGASLVPSPRHAGPPAGRRACSPLDQLELRFRRGLGQEVVDAGFGGNGRRRQRIVAGDHHRVRMPMARGLREALAQPAALDDVLQVDHARGRGLICATASGVPPVLATTQRRSRRPRRTSAATAQGDRRRAHGPAGRRLDPSGRAPRRPRPSPDRPSPRDRRRSVRVCAVNGMKCRSASEQRHIAAPDVQQFAFARPTIEAALRRLVGRASDDCATSAGCAPRRRSARAAETRSACRLPSVIVPVLSEQQRARRRPPCLDPAQPGSSPGRCARPPAGPAPRCRSPRQQRADRRRDRNEPAARPASMVRDGCLRIDGERLRSSHRRQQEDERQSGEEDVERNLIRRLLAARSGSTSRDHARSRNVIAGGCS